MMGQPELINSIAMLIDRVFFASAIFCLGPLALVSLQIAVCFLFFCSFLFCFRTSSGDLVQSVQRLSLAIDDGKHVLEKKQKMAFTKRERPSKGA